jgi:PhnB protein
MPNHAEIIITLGPSATAGGGDGERTFRLAPMSVRAAERLHWRRHHAASKELPPMAFRPYLAFAGNCREAFTRYQEVFGGELVLLTMDEMAAQAGPPAAGTPGDAIMHAALVNGADLLMGADDPYGNFDGKVRGQCVNYAAPDVGEAKRVFDALADGGEVQMPMGETFFSPAFGLCTDRFGTPWMIMVDTPTPS